MKKILTPILFLAIFSCSEPENNLTNCSFVDCFGGALLSLEFHIEGENILITDPNTEIVILQNADTSHYHTDTISNSTSLFLYDDDPISIIVNGKAKEFSFTSTYVEGECCSGIRIDKMMQDNIEICSGTPGCSETIILDWDE